MVTIKHVIKTQLKSKTDYIVNVYNLTSLTITLK